MVKVLYTMIIIYLSLEHILTQYPFMLTQPNSPSGSFSGSIFPYISLYTLSKLDR